MTSRGCSTNSDAAAGSTSPSLANSAASFRRFSAAARLRVSSPQLTSVLVVGCSAFFGGQCRHLGRKRFTLGRHVRYIFVDVDLGNHKMRFAAKRFLETVEICFATVFEATTFSGLLLDSCEYPQLVVRQLTHMHTHRLGTLHAPLGALVIGLQQTFLIGNAGQILGGSANVEPAV